MPPAKRIKVLLLHNRASEREAGHLAALSDALNARGIEVAIVDAEDDFSRISHAVLVERPDLVFNLVTQFREDTLQHPNVASLLELQGLPYTGSEPLSLSTCQDRLRTHLLLEDAGVPVTPYAVVRDINAIPATADLAPPLLISHAFDDLYDEPDIRILVRTRGELEAQARSLAADGELPLMVERWVAGRRIHAVVLGNRTLEVLPLAARIVGEDGRLGPIQVAQVEVGLADQVRALSQRAFRVLDCRDCAQIDFALGDAGELFVIDARPVFDMFSGSAFVVGAQASALGFEGAVAHLVEIALARYQVDEVPLPLSREDSAPMAVPQVLATGTQQMMAPPEAPAEAPAVAPPPRKKREPRGPQRRPAGGGGTRHRLATEPIAPMKPPPKKKKPPAAKKPRPAASKKKKKD